MKRILSLAAVSLLIAGCHNNPPASTANSGVTQLAPPPVAPSAQPQPVAYDQAVASNQPVGAIDTSTPPLASDSTGTLSAATGGKYTVKHGDTLYRIAVNHYGDGKQWKKIAAANPGVSPSTLKAGQTIILP